jgi:hypothetical protein
VKDWNTDRPAASSPLREVNKVKIRMAMRHGSNQSSSGRCWLAGSTSDSSNEVTGQRWRSSCKPFMIKDTTLPRSLEVS